jgi:hypothetical protein
MGVLLLISGIAIVGLWLWMAWANKGGRSWARIMATIFFAILTAAGAAVLIKFGFRTGELRPSAGSGIHVPAIPVYLFFFVYWLTGLSAVTLLWQRSSRDYYTAAGNHPE